MNPFSIPPLIAAGIVFYAGFYQLLIYLRRRHRRQDISFALTCFTVGIYDIFCAGLYSAHSVAEGVEWQRGQVTALALIGLCLLHFISDFTGEVSKKWLYGFSFYFILAAFFNVFVRNHLTWIPEQPSIKNINLPFNLTVTYFEAAPGLITNIQSVIGLVLGGYLTFIAIRLYKSAEKTKTRVLFWAVIAFFGAVINDTAVSSGIYNFIYTIEYANLGILILMANSLSNEVLEASVIKDALRESEERHRIVSELTSDFAFSLAQNSDGTLTPEWATGAWTQITGYSFEEAIEKGWQNLLHPDDLVTLIPLFETITERSINLPELRIITKNGETRWLRFVCRSIQDSKQNHLIHIIGAGQDITERKHAEEKIREAEKKYRSIFENAVEGIFQSSPDGYFTRVNPALARMLGYKTPEELLESRDDVLKQLFTNPDHRAELTRRVIEKGEVHNYESQVRRKDGKWIWLSESMHAVRDDQDNILYFEGTVEDITERKRAEEALRRSNKRLEVLHKIDQAILTAESPEKIALVALEHFQSLVPCSHACVIRFDFKTGVATILAILTKGSSQIKPGVQLDLAQLVIPETLMHGKAFIVDDLSALSDHSPFHQQLLSEGIRSIVKIPLMVQNRLTGALILGEALPASLSSEQIEVAREIADVVAVAIQQAQLHEQVKTYSQELEEKVRQRTLELETKNRELETFTYSVSHDLKAPLRGIDGYSYLLMEDYYDKLGKEGQTFITSIRSAVKLMNQLIDDLLAYSRLEKRTLTKEQVHLPTIIETITSERETEIQERGVKVTINLPYHSITTEAEGITQAFRNLIDNAFKFTRDVPHPHIEIGGAEEEDGYLLWIKDNGIGFDMQFHDRIFEIFQRLHYAEDYPGTGIGLALVKKVMQRLGGRVWAVSSLGAGATFYLKLPKV